MSASDIPKAWSAATLSELGDWSGGGTPSKSIDEYWNGDIPWISPKDMKHDAIFDSADHITRSAIENSAAKLIPRHSILFVTRSGILAHTFPVALTMVPVTVNQDIKALTPFREIDARYLAWLLRAKGREILETCSKDGTTVNSIETARLHSLSVPIAPQNEQHRIVEKIEELFSELENGLESLRTAKAQLDIYRQALLKHAFEGKLTAHWRANNAHKLETADALLQRIQRNRAQRYQQQCATWAASGKTERKPKAPKDLPAVTADELAALPALPMGWAWVRLGNTNADIFDGPFGSNLKSSDYVDRGVRVIRLENIGVLKFVGSKKSYVTENKYDSLKAHTVSSGDIIFSSFITENVRVAMLPSEVKKAVNKADCFCVRPFGEMVDSKFLVMFLSTRNVFKQLEAQIHGVGRPRINTMQLKNVFVPICGLDEQLAVNSEIESRLSETTQLDQTITAALQQAAALRESILKRAFSGQLVPQDPNDEPAFAMLERIKAAKAAPGRKRKIRES